MIRPKCISRADLFINPFFQCQQGSDVDNDDLKELLNDTRLLKKLKRGRISEEDFEKQITSGPTPKHGTGGASRDSLDEEDV